MADTKVSALTALAAADAAAGDLLYVADVSAGASGSKKMVLSEALDAALRVADAGDVVLLDATADKLVVRQRGGTPDTDEVQISHDGTDGRVHSLDGRLILRPSTHAGLAITSGGPGGNCQLIQGLENVGVVFGPGVGSMYGGFTAGQLFFGTTNNNGLYSPAAGVVGITDGATAGGTLASVPLTPTALSANVNDYAPGTARRYRLATDASGNKDITGLVIAGNVTGLELSVVNVGAADSIVLKHQSASSTAANRFICTGAADIALATDEEALLWYDGVTARWRARKV